MCFADMLHYWPAFPIGIIIAVLVTMFGIGGGVFWAPILLFGFKLSVPETVMASLLIQIGGIGSGTIKYLRSKQVDIKTGFIIILFSIPGIIFGSYMSKLLSRNNFELVLGLVTFAIGLLFVVSNSEYKTSNIKADTKKVYKMVWLPFILSNISGLLSIGIGDFLVPIFNIKLKLKMRNSVATAIFIMFFVVVFSSLTHFAMGNRINVGLLLFAVPGVIIGGQLGPIMSKYIDEQRLKELFVFIISLIGMHIIINAV